MVGSRNAHIAGSVRGLISDDDIDKVARRVIEHLRLVEIGAVAPAIRERGMTLRVERGSGAQRVQLDADFDHWRDLASKIVDKVRQTSRSGATWLRIDWSSEAWKLEHLQGGFAARAEAMHSFLRPLLDGADHLHGIVVTDGAFLTCGAVLSDQLLDLDANAVGVCQSLPGIRRRESVIVTRTPEHRAEASVIVDLYKHEANWFTVALAARNLVVPPEFLLRNRVPRPA